MTTPATITQLPIKARHVVMIEPREKWWRIRWAELWNNRELLFFLVWRDIKVRYKQTVLGFIWVLIQPLSAVVIFSVFFGRLAHIPTDGLPYPLLAYTGTLLWQFFARSLSEASTALAANERLLTKIYFPRLYLPTSVVLAALVDLMVALVLAIPFVAYYGYAPRWTLILVPGVIFMTMMASIGIGLMFSSLDVRYRDVRHVLPFITQVWMFASPVVYPSALVPARWRALFAVNPMVGFIETFRGALIGSSHVPWKLLGISCGAALVFFVVGLFIFQGTERRIADIV
jgi:lipopolysaccharide transport system permease protein